MTLLLLALLGVVGLMLVFALPPVGLGLFIFSGRYSVGRFESYLADQSQASEYMHLWIAPIILVVLCLSLFARLVSAERIGKPKSAIPVLPVVLVLGFGLVLLAGCLYSPAQSQGITKALEYIFLIQFAFFAPMIVANSARRYGLLLLTLFLVPLSLACIGLVLAVESEATGVARVAALGGGPNVYARFMGVGMFACLALILITERRLLKLGLLLGLILLFLAFLLAGSRGVLLALIPSAVFFVLVAMVMGAWGTTRTKAIVASLIIMTAIALVILGSYERLPLPNVERYEYLWEELPGSGAVSARLLYWQDAVSMFCSKPLLGYGTGAFAPVAVGVESRAYPHNIILEVAAETGITGLLLFGGFIMLISRSIFRLIVCLRTGDMDARLRPFALATAAGFVFYFAAAQFSGDLYDSRFIWLFGGMILALEAIVRRDKADGAAMIQGQGS